MSKKTKFLDVVFLSTGEYIAARKDGREFKDCKEAYDCLQNLNIVNSSEFQVFRVEYAPSPKKKKTNPKVKRGAK